MALRRVDTTNIDPAVIAEAAAIIQRGGLVAFPTETVYGLGANALDASAVARIYAAKGRPAYNPLIVHVADVTGALRCVASWPESAVTLARTFWPGPLTLVLPKDTSIPDLVTAGLPTVGVRMPAHPVALALLRAANVPIAAPSANRSMQVSPTAGSHVEASLGATPDLILDAGPSTVGIESTVLDLTTAVPTILRPGTISADALREVIGPVAMVKDSLASAGARPSPGMLDRHYSPAARLVVTDQPGFAAVVAAARREGAAGKSVVALARTTVSDDACAVWQMPEAAADYARALYATLHRADAEGFGVIIVEAVPEDAAWDGVRDRVTRASR